MTPSSWEDPCNGIEDPAMTRSIAQPTLRALDAIAPGVADCRIDQVTAGIIFLG